MVVALAMLDNKQKTGNRTLFLATICLGSLLLFLVQPMVARMALPRLGGSPSVWNSAMLVYQSLLLAGYAYAHWLSRFAAKKQAYIHVSLFATAALMLPIGLSNANPPVDGSPYFWVPWLFISSIGPLFFVVAAQAPLMQRWFALSGGGDPYPLYAASNLGSFGGLLAYPLIVEPLLAVTQQSLLWSTGYVTLIGFVALCALRLPKYELAVESAAIHTAQPGRTLFWRWALLAAVPSGLMLSTSLHLTTDIVAMPLIWVLPLGLYLLSFSVAFAERRGLAVALTRVSPFFIVFAACATFVDATAFPFALAGVTLVSLFVIAVAIHSRMFDLRPEPAHLTRFYLAMSVGGMLGGLFCALIAPLIFDWTYEHPILLMAAALLVVHQPIFAFTAKFSDGSKAATRATRLGTIALLFIAVASIDIFEIPVGLSMTMLSGLILVSLAPLTFGNRVLFPVLVGAVLLSMNGWDRLAMSIADGKMTRSFFGIYSIGMQAGKARTLVHGTTVHGIQMLDTVKSTMPTTYYAPKSGVGLAMTAAPALFGGKARIGVVGLGAGTLSCYSQPGQDWRYYEIDPVIVDIARNPKNFTFISQCLPGVTVETGDARLVLAEEANRKADLLVIDAFSSDSVPMHLLTLEAFETYRKHISDNGLLMVHISNRYLDLRPVLAGAASHGWTARIRRYAVTDDERKNFYTPSLWVALSPNKETIAKLEASSGSDGWSELKGRADFTPWTDDYGSILPLLMIGK